MVSNFKLSENMAQPTIEPTSPNFGLIFKSSGFLWYNWLKFKPI